MANEIRLGAENLSDADRADIIRRYQANEKVADIGKVYGVSGAFVSTLARGHGLKRINKAKIATPEQVRRILEMERGGATRKAIAIALDMRPDRISSILRANGRVSPRGYSRRGARKVEEQAAPVQRPCVDSVIQGGETLREKVLRLSGPSKRLPATKIAPLVGLRYSEVQEIIDGAQACQSA